MKQRFEDRLETIRKLSEWVESVYTDTPPDEEQQMLLKLLEIYKADTNREMNQLPAPSGYWEQLKVGIRIAKFLMADVRAEDGDSLAGWQLGAEPRNPMQGYYAMLAEIQIQLSCSIYGQWREAERSGSQRSRSN